MITQINTKKLKNIINPEIDGVIYNNELIKVDFEKLKTFINNPEEHNILSLNNNSDDLYKELSFYIINNSNEKHFTTIDLDNANNVFINGMFAFLKSIYLKEENTFISLNDTGDNSLLIKSNKLIELNDSNIKPIPNNLTFDVYSEIYSDIPNENLYSDIDFLIESTEDILKKSYESYRQHKSDSKLAAEIDDSFCQLISVANNEVVFSDEFKTKLLKVNNISLDSNILLKLFANKKSKLNSKFNFNYDFLTEDFFKIIKEDVNNQSFKLLEFVFETYHNVIFDDNHPIKPLLLELINHPNTIKNLISYSNYPSSFSFSRDHKLTYLSSFPLFNDLNKNNIDNVIHYIDNVIHYIDKSLNDSNNYLRDYVFKEIPFEAIKTDIVLKKLLPVLEHEQIKVLLNTGVHQLSDKEFILNNLKINSNTFNYIVKNGIGLENIDKEFVLQVAAKNTYLFKNLDTPFKKDLEVLYHAVQHGLEMKSFNFKLQDIKSEFLKEDNISIEKFKIDLLIKLHYDNIGNLAKSFFKHQDDIDTFNSIYNKLELVLLKHPDSYSLSKDKNLIRLMKAIKTPEDVSNLFEKIHSLNLDYSINTYTFYEHLNNNLKKNPQVVCNILDNGNIDYSHLPIELTYNSKVLISFIRTNPSIISKIQDKMFNNKEFTLEFAKLMDEGIVSKEHTPPFIIKFYEINNIKEDYHAFLSTFINNKELNSFIPHNIKKNKISNKI